MTFEDLMALLGDCADREKEKMFDKELSDTTINFIDSVVAISKKYGKDANVKLMLATVAALDIARTFDFNKPKGGKGK